MVACNAAILVFKFDDVDVFKLKDPGTKKQKVTQLRGLNRSA